MRVWASSLVWHRVLNTIRWGVLLGTVGVWSFHLVFGENGFMMTRIEQKKLHYCSAEKNLLERKCKILAAQLGDETIRLEMIKKIAQEKLQFVSRRDV